MGSLAPARSGLRPFAPQKPFRAPPGGSSLEMADEALARGHQRPSFNKPGVVPKDCAWPSLLARDGDELESVVSANLQRATRLRQSILQKAFTGGLV